MVTYLLCTCAFAHTHTTVRRWNCRAPISPNPNCLEVKQRYHQQDNPLHPIGKRDFPQTGNEPVLSFRHPTSSAHRTNSAHRMNHLTARNARN